MVKRLHENDYSETDEFTLVKEMAHWINALKQDFVDDKKVQKAIAQYFYYDEGKHQEDFKEFEATVKQLHKIWLKLDKISDKIENKRTKKEVKEEIENGCNKYKVTLYVSGPDGDYEETIEDDYEYEDEDSAFDAAIDEYLDHHLELRPEDIYDWDVEIVESINRNIKEAAYSKTNTIDIITNFFKQQGWNVNDPEVQNYIDGVYDLLIQDPEWIDGTYTMDDWYLDTKVNFPTDIDWLDHTAWGY